MDDQIKTVQANVGDIEVRVVKDDIQFYKGGVYLISSGKALLEFFSLEDFNNFIKCFEVMKLELEGLYCLQ